MTQPSKNYSFSNRFNDPIADKTDWQAIPPRKKGIILRDHFLAEIANNQLEYQRKVPGHFFILFFGLWFFGMSS